MLILLYSFGQLSGLEKSNASDGETRKAAITSSIVSFVISEKYNITPCAYNYNNNNDTACMHTKPHVINYNTAL